MTQYMKADRKCHTYFLSVYAIDLNATNYKF